MSAQFENLVEHFDLAENDLRRASLRDLQHEQAEGLRKSGILAHAVIRADKNDQVINPDTMHWACVYKDKNTYGIRFTSLYGDVLDEEMPISIVDVPVYEVVDGRTVPLNLFEKDDVIQVQSAVAALELEKEIGLFPELSDDLTELILPGV